MSGNDLQPVDVTGPTLEEAINNGLAQLGLARNEVIIEIIEEGSKGILGMGARPAVVRLIPLRSPRPSAPATIPQSPRREARPAPEKHPPSEKAKPGPAPAPRQPAPPRTPEPEDEEDADDLVEYAGAEAPDDEREASVAHDTLQELLGHMGIKASIQVRRAQQTNEENEPAPWVLNIRGRDLGILIGRRGETLNALQYIARLIVSRELQHHTNFVVDVEGYKLRRESTLRALAKRMAERARSQRRTMTLEPMPPNERRIIHLTLRTDETVRTESVGTGDDRKVTIIPVDSSR
ncbi:MAG: hypothetical protein Kow00124_03790 [Anaerolineae bacterium]